MEANRNASEILRSPRILSVAWGRMEVEGIGHGCDFKLWPAGESECRESECKKSERGGRAWDWRETGMHHEPGIGPAEVLELLEHGCEVVVLSRGFEGALHVTPEVLAFLEERGIPVHVEKTEAAVETYNRLAAKGKRVGGLFHSTC